MRHSNVSPAAGRTPRFPPGMIARVVCRWMPAVCAVVLIGMLMSGGGTSYGAPTGMELPTRDTKEAGRTVFLPLVTVDPRLTPEQAADQMVEGAYPEMPAGETKETIKTAIEHLLLAQQLNETGEVPLPEEVRQHANPSQVTVMLNRVEEGENIMMPNAESPDDRAPVGSTEFYAHVTLVRMEVENGLDGPITLDQRGKYFSDLLNKGFGGHEALTRLNMRALFGSHFSTGPLGSDGKPIIYFKMTVRIWGISDTDQPIEDQLEGFKDIGIIQ